MSAPAFVQSVCSECGANLRDFLSVPEVAARLGMTPSALRVAIHRKAKWLPPFMHLGGKLRCARMSYERWAAGQIAAAEAAAEAQTKGPGRPRRQVAI